ncbi:MAG: type II toxin-antitoxin system Phd/YefM family antitoxin [Nitrospinota bacterium]
MRIGLREANLHFSKYMKIVKEGKEVVVTDRGTPIAVIKPLLQEEDSPENRIKLLEEQGVLRQATSGKFPIHKLITIGGKPISEIVIEERENRF